MSLKVSTTLNYLVGFNVFANANSTSAISGGDSAQLQWMLSDLASNLKITVFGLFAAASALI